MQYLSMLYSTKLTGLPFLLPLTGLWFVVRGLWFVVCSLWFVDEPQNQNFKKAKCEYIFGRCILCKQAKSHLIFKPV